MWKTLLRAFVLYSVVITTASCCKPGPRVSLPVTLHPQETRMWCWAASGQMVMDYLGNNVSQCVQANNRFGRNDCPCSQCTNPINNPPCVSGGWPEFGKYGFEFMRTSNAPLPWAALKKELSTKTRCGRTPVAFSWHWNGGGGHMMVVVGYQTVGGTNYVKILDPWGPCAGDDRIITYDYYVSSPPHHTHWDDFYAIRTK